MPSSNSQERTARAAPARTPRTTAAANCSRSARVRRDSGVVHMLSSSMGDGLVIASADVASTLSEVRTMPSSCDELPHFPGASQFCLPQCATAIMLCAMSGDEKTGSQRAIRRPRVPPGPLADLKALLYELYLEAGTPRLDQIEEWLARTTPRDASPGRDTVARIVGGATMPPSYADLAIVVTVLARAALWDAENAVQRARDLWVAARMDSARIPAGGVQVSQADPRRLGVHAAISVPGVADEIQPEYVPRDADEGESGVRATMAAAARRGGFVLLVGGSSVGKTRCAFEAVTALLPEWWLVHPAGPGEVAALAAASAPQTVVWLDELERYLDGEHGLTGGVLRALLNPPHPAVIIGTLWPDRYTAYTTLPAPGCADQHARQKEVLDLAAVVRLPPEFSPSEKERARAAAHRDPRLRVALGTAGYGLTQTLAAAPQLVARWQDAQTASPYAWAVITAALDIARLGGSAPLSADLLRAAAPGYCTSQQKAEAPENWIEQAFSYATGKVLGAAAALSPVGADMGRTAGYIPADYLVQHASRERRFARVPGNTWDAAVCHIHDHADTARLARSAENRLLHCYALPLYRHAADAGNSNAAEQLAHLLAERGELDEAEQILRARASDTDEDSRYARFRLVSLLAERGKLDEAQQILRAQVDAGDGLAALRLADLLAEHGDIDGLRARADAGDRTAAEHLARLLAERGDINGLLAQIAAGDTRSLASLVNLLAERGDFKELRAWADGGSAIAAVALAELLAERGNLEEAEQILRARADAGDWYVALRLADLLAGLGELDEAEQILRAQAHSGDEYSNLAALQLADLLAQRGKLDEAKQILQALADVGDHYAFLRLTDLLADHGNLDELRTRADAGDMTAAQRLARVLAERGDIDELRVRADADDYEAALRLARVLAERRDIDELRTRTDAGDQAAAEQLADVLSDQVQEEEAESLRWFGLNADGSIAHA
jgi:predicted negative regulator of RcsB-dependent stress response